MATPDNPLNLLDYFATKPVLSKVKNTIIFNYFNMLSCFSVFANPSSLEKNENSRSPRLQAFGPQAKQGAGPQRPVIRPKLPADQFRGGRRLTDGVAKTHQLLRCCNCSRHCGVPKFASFLDNCAPCIWRFLLSHSLFLLSCESILTITSPPSRLVD
jgi:hypothetical protein